MCPREAKLKGTQTDNVQVEKQPTTQAVPLPTANQPFVLFDLELSDVEKECLNSIAINRIAHYENYGRFDLLRAEVCSYIGSLGGNSEYTTSIVAQLVERLVLKVIRFTGQETLWVTMRAFIPVETFKIPRWHADGYYYPSTQEQYKVAITLKGPGTLFYNASPTERARLDYLKQNIPMLTQELDSSLILHTEYGQGSIFVVGTDYAPFHTEPNITANRLFLSMIPGSKSQIQTLYEKTPEHQIIKILTVGGFFCYFMGPRLHSSDQGSPYNDTEILVFKLPGDDGSISSLDCIYQIMEPHKGKIQTSVSYEEEQNLIQCVFENGAIITLSDISRFFANQSEDIYKILSKYLYLRKNNQTVSILELDNVYDVFEGSISSVSGENIAGLFFPSANTAKPNLIVRQADTQPSLPSAQQPFTYFDLELSDEERECLRSLDISSVAHYENYGALDILLDEVTEYVKSFGNNEQSKAAIVAALTKKIVHKVVNLTHLETAWVTLRAFTPVSIFAGHRWHPDRYDYPPTGEQYKAAVTLKGQSTLFYNATPKQREDLESIQHDRVMLEQQLDKNLIVSAEPDKGTVFIIGARYAPIHSEPDTISDRLFMAILPGTNEQIKRLYLQTPERDFISLLTENEFYCYFAGPRLNNSFVVSPYEDTELIVFKVNTAGETNLLSLISSIIQDHNSQMQIELINHQLHSFLRVKLPQGGYITIDDISDFFRKNSDLITDEQDVYLALHKYANYCRKLDKKMNFTASERVVDSMLSIPPTRTRGFVFNSIAGTNTFGLFKPHHNYISTRKQDEALLSPAQAEVSKHKFRF